jgi:hypothetical protein
VRGRGKNKKKEAAKKNWKLMAEFNFIFFFIVLFSDSTLSYVNAESLRWYLQKEGTTLLLADIFSTCFGWEPIKPIKESSLMQPVNGSRIDPKFVNNSELSDVTFRWAFQHDYYNPSKFSLDNWEIAKNPFSCSHAYRTPHSVLHNFSLTFSLFSQCGRKDILWP